MFKHRSRTIALMAAASAAFLLVVDLSTAGKPPPRPTVKYSIALLGTMGGASTGADSLNNLGDVVGSPPFVYTAEDGMVDLNDLNTNLPGWTLTTVWDINDSGQIVGSMWGNVGSSHGYRYTPGAEAPFEDLSLLGGHSPHAINGRGDVIGLIDDPTQNRRFACFWPDGNGAEPGGISQVIQTPLDDAYGLNDSGQIAGWVTVNGENRAVRYTVGGGVEYLPVIGSYRGSFYGRAMDINASGQVAGQSITGRGARHAFRYTDGVGTRDLGTLGGYNSLACSINSSGHVVGMSEVKNYGPNRPFLFRDDVGMIDLQAAITNLPATVTSLSVPRINDAGQICVTASLADGTSQACLLTPVP